MMNRKHWIGLLALLAQGAALAAIINMAGPRLFTAGGGGGNPEPTLWVDGGNPSCSDSTSKATNAASAGASPWCTIGRAAWGSTTRSSPNTGEAAAAGDVVSIAAGTYSTSESVNDQKIPVYNPANAGSSGSPITFMAAGDVRLAAPSANSPVAGANGKDYITWTVTSSGRWLIECDGRGGTTADTKAAGLVNTRPDSGPVVAWDATGTVLEGFDIDGGPQLDYTDNWDGIRVEEGPSTEIRNNTIYSFHNLDDTTNGTAIKLYGCPDCIVEHNDLSDAGLGIALKDSAGVVFETNQNIHIRFNFIHGTDSGFGMSMTSEGRNYVYQNKFIDVMHGFNITGGGFTNDWFFNNTIVTASGAGLYWASNSGSGARFWNNIFVSNDYVIYLNGFTMPADTTIDYEHNCYYTFTNFYAGSDGNRSFASFNAAYTDQNAASPASVNSDPLFTNAGTGDYTLQAGSPCRSIAADPGGFSQMVHAGAYQTGSEVIGVEP